MHAKALEIGHYLQSRARSFVARVLALILDRNCPGSSAKSGLWPRQRPESQFFQRKFAYRPPLRGGTWAPSRGTWAVTLDLAIRCHWTFHPRSPARGEDSVARYLHLLKRVI